MPQTPPDPGLLTVLMPVFNERSTLTTVLDRVLAVPVRKEIVIVDDASTDGTTDLLRRSVDGRYPNVTVIYRERNGGKGAAIRTGIPAIRGEFVVIQDGDLEYEPEDFVRLLERLRATGASAVYGSRFLGARPRMRLLNWIINRLLVALVRVLYGARLSDEATCYKLFRSQLLQGLPLNCRRFEFCPEVTAKVLRSGHQIVEMPIRYTARTHAQGKKIRWTDGVSAILTLLRYRFWRPQPSATRSMPSEL
jgi:dolichol-phosphate mannosyltransferase